MYPPGTALLLDEIVTWIAGLEELSSEILKGKYHLMVRQPAHEDILPSYRIRVCCPRVALGMEFRSLAIEVA
jgi:hypothetical protein